MKLTGQFDSETGNIQVADNVTDLEINPVGLAGSSYSKSLILYPQTLSAPIPIEVMWRGR